MPVMDPTHTTALESLDFGDSILPDGRAHPITANTSAAVVSVPGVLSAPAASDPTTPAGGNASNVSFSVSDLWDTLTGKNHVALRAVVGLIAVGIILIVVFRLTNPR